LKEQDVDVKLYVGNIKYNTSEDGLRELFSQAGGVSSVAMIQDRSTGMFKGFAFVEMDSQASAQKAISMFNAYMWGEKQLAVSVARPREEPARGGFQNRNRDQKRGGGKRRY
jgi:cold-inducible RNA-binding protein